MRSAPVILKRLEMQACELSTTLSGLFFGDIHQQVFSFRVVRIQPLDRILHRGGEFPVGAADRSITCSEARIGGLNVRMYTSVALCGGTCRIS